MAYRDSYGGGGFGGGTLTPWVKRLLIANTAIYVASLFLRFSPGTAGLLRDYVAFAPGDFLTRPWTVVTYSFLHFGVFHLLWNMLTLFFFGPQLEDRWGGRAFIRFYLIAAAGGAALSALLYFLDPATWIVGASGATLGLMLAFAMIWPDMEVHILGIFPVKMKWLVAGIAFINIASSLDGSGRGVAVFAHLGGMLAAFLYLKSPWAPKAWGEMSSVPRKRQQSRGGGMALVPWGGKKQPVSGTPAATATQTRPAPARSAKAERELLDDVDRILDKISAQGLSSLSEEERKRLDEVSRRYRTN